MDSQEKTLEMGTQEEQNLTAATPTEEANVVEEAEKAEVKEPVEAPVAEEEPATANEPERKVYNSKKDILERIKEIAHGEEPLQKEEIDYLKKVKKRKNQLKKKIILLIIIIKYIKQKL